MGYEGPHPLPVSSGMLGVSTVTGIVTNNGGQSVTGNSLTQYNTLSGGANSTIENIPPSSASGYGICSNGPSSLASYKNIPGTSLVFLSTQTASSSPTVSFTSLITSAYSLYYVTFRTVSVASSNRNVTCRFSTDNGSSYITANYLSGVLGHSYNSTSYSNSTSTSSCFMSLLLATSARLSGCMWLYNLVGSNIPHIVGMSSSATAANSVFNKFESVNTANTNINAIQFLASSGNLAIGTFTLYGVKQL